ncbi:MAG: pyruvate flavodoxin/ferredoxin oxidoreductase [Ignavibacteriae bacterium]|nr:pyruvate flavodoxin/ferredoxin oxidoreductase [Ignavibacteriota bacterium]
MNHTQTSIKLRTGNQMIAEGAVKAGCRFFAGYPITPASGIYKSMIELLQRKGDLAISSPDEISALAYCVGASLRGYKAMTATSGPGWALMIETVQYALMTETPLVIAMVQRLGPSTGGATQGAQGDVLLTEFCTSGGYTIPVLCPSTPLECYELTVLAFSWAELLRTPVVILTDKEVGMTTESVNYEQLQLLHAAERISHLQKPTNGRDKAKTYEFSRLSDIPKFAPVGGMLKVTATGSAHNKSGELKKNDAETLEVLHHLEEKIKRRKDGLAIVKRDVEPEANTLLISYGITARAMEEAIHIARKQGRKVSGLHLLTLFPVPEKQILNSLGQVKRVVIAEENLSGQYRSVISHLMKTQEVVGINKIGSMITPQEILKEVL